MRIGLQAWGSEGDIQPFTALAAGLVRSGHEVTLAVTDNIGRDYSGLAERFGYRLVVAPNPQAQEPQDVERVWRQIIDLGNPIRQAELVMKYGFDPALETMYSAATDLCQRNDAVIGHFFVYPLRVAAEKAGVPVATVNIVHNCLPSSSICPPGLPDLGKWFYPLGWKIVRMAVNRIFLPRVNALRRREGLAPDEDVMTQTWASSRLNLIAVSRHICRTPGDWGPQHHVCGFLRPPATLGVDALPDGLNGFLEQGSPPVYITFGSMMPNSFEYIRETAGLWLEATQRAGCRAVIQLPWEDLSAFPTDQNVFKVRRAPYGVAFPRCAMVIHHGGAGTTQSALLSGRPSIIVAHVSDQFFWGSELERLGAAGRTLRRRGLTSKQLADGICYVLARPHLAEQAGTLGRLMQREDGVSTAVGLIQTELLQAN